MNNYQRLWLKAVVVLVLLSVLVACSSNGNNDNNTNGNTNGSENGSANGGKSEVAEPEVVEPPEDVTIEVWDQLADTDPRLPNMEKIWQEFTEKYPHITVEHKPMPEDDRQAFVTAMAGGSGPDAYQNAHFPTIRSWVDQGFTLDLTPYWEQYADNGKFIDSSMAQATVDGKVFGLPNHMYTTGLFYNKTLFEEAGLDPQQPPKDWGEFAEYAEKLTDPDKDQYGYALLGMEWADWHFEYYVWQAGGDLTTENEDGTVTLTFTDEPAVKALQYYKDLKWKHKVVQSNVLQWIGDNFTDFTQGRAAMYLNASNSFGALATNGLDLNNVGFAPFPAGPSGKAPAQVGGAYWIINPETSKEKQDAAWLYISYLMSKEVQEKKLQFAEDNGNIPNLLSVRSDVNPGDYAEEAPQDIIDGVNKAAKNSRLEYFLKERLSPYVVAAVQTILTDENADPLEELEKAQKKAQSEVVDPYNKEIKN